MIIPIVLMVMVVAIVLLVRSQEDEGGMVCALVIVFIVGAIMIGCFKWVQIGHQEELKKLAKYEAIYLERRDNMLGQIKMELLEKYPAYEKAVLASVMKGSGKSINVAVPPQLHVSEAVVEATKQIVAFNDKIYDVRLEVEDQKAAMRVNNRVGPVFVPFVFYPAHE